MESNVCTKERRREVYDRPEERDLRVLAVVAGIDRLGRANALTPYELSIALKLALAELVAATRAPMSTIHQFRGYLLDIEAGLAMSPMGEALTADSGEGDGAETSGSSR